MHSNESTNSFLQCLLPCRNIFSFAFFSSHEHVVLSVSYCDRSPSDVRLSVNNYLTVLLNTTKTP